MAEPFNANAGSGSAGTSSPQPGAGSAPPTTSSTLSSATTGAVAPAGGGSGAGAGSDGWSMPESYRGKSVEDIARMHYEAERKLGDQGNELGKWRQYGDRVNSFMSQWQPIFERVGGDPNRLVAALERAASQAAQSGDPNAARQATAAAAQARRWADAVTADDQEQWIQSALAERERAMGDRMTQRERELLQGVTQYINNFGDIALRAIQSLFNALPETSRPKMSLYDVLGDAVRFTSGGIDPIEAAVRARTAETEEQMRERIRREERARLEAEAKNSQLTTFVGASGSSPRPMLPPQLQSPVAGNGAGNGTARVPEGIAMARARQNWLSKMGPELFSGR